MWCMPWQASGCVTELSSEEVEAGEVDQLVKRLVTLVNEVKLVYLAQIPA